MMGSFEVPLWLLTAIVCWFVCNGKDINVKKIENNELEDLQTKPRQYPPTYFPQPAHPSAMFAGCPLCDSSVYSYCSFKMMHDACCCEFPVFQLKPPQCFHFDCALLYAKSCYEHQLIKNCCCNNPY